MNEAARKSCSDHVKIAVVQMGLEDNDLRRHLLARVDRLTTYSP